MTPQLTADSLTDINQKITDRSNVFYWQTDRDITPQEAGAIWADRHSYFTGADIIAAVNAELSDDPVVSLEPLDMASQTSLGNINSVRVAQRASGQEIIIRCHPRGIRNGYFYVETLASHKALAEGLPAYRTFAIHDLQTADDFAFQVIEKLPGTAVKHWLDQHPKDEPALLEQIGHTMALVHRIKVEGFGPFDNLRAKNGELHGLHQSFGEAVRAGLDFNLKVLTERDVLTKKQAVALDKLLAADNPLLACQEPVLIHNDFADWNLLTDGKKLTGLLDWDEAVGGDPATDIACWSTFFAPERLDGMLKGYWKVAKKPVDFEEKFELLRLRYTLSKMTLRLRRYEWHPAEDVKERIEAGKHHLAASLKHFKLG